MEIDITDSVSAFRAILDSSWAIVKEISKVDTTNSFIEDWMQSSWERIVESSIPPSEGLALEPYGEGADCNLRSSRVWRPEINANSAVYIRYLGNDPLINLIDGSEINGELKLDHFCTIKDGWPTVDSPFDCVSLDSEATIVIPIDKVRYYVSTT